MKHEFLKNNLIKSPDCFNLLIKIITLKPDYNFIDGEIMKFNFQIL